MTSIVGVLCRDGVVIGADSSATFGPTIQYKTIEQRYERKIEVIGNSVLVACSGSIGLAQRFACIVHNAWHDTTTGGQIRKATQPVEIGTILSQAAITDFGSTNAPKCLSALVALQCRAGPQLYEFDLEHFQPERKTADLWYCSQGSAQPITDPFLGLMREIFWNDGLPSVYDAIFAVAWTLEHAIQVNPGGVNGPIHVAALQPGRANGPKAWILDNAELDEHRQHIEAIKQQLRDLARAGSEMPALEIPKPTM